MTEKAKAKRSCSQCGGDMEMEYSVLYRYFCAEPDYIKVNVCKNPACPSYALLQIPKEQMP